MHAAWGSTIGFDAGIPVALDGTLALEVDSRYAFLLVPGQTYGLFDWTGVAPSGTFAAVTTLPSLTWDTASLYTTGDVTLTGVDYLAMADYAEALIDEVAAAIGSADMTYDLDGDGDVDADDLATLVEDYYGTNVGDFNLDGAMDLLDFARVGDGYVGDGDDWAHGDANGDGIVNLLDLGLFGDSYLAAQAEVPEPASMSLLAMGALALLRRRK